MVKIGMLIADRYEVLEKTGTGGMSVVYRAKDHKLNRTVAIKVLKQEFSDNANFVSKFRVEAQAAAGLMHPNIVNVYDVGEEKGMYYIVMEYVDGITLKKYIEKKSRLTVKEAISIAIQVSMGLQAAHNNHVIHRDIKPQNIMISRDGKVKVTDFGIAKAATSNTITSNVMGSVHYTSPEQARGGYSDERSDIYSLGITLFEMLTGRVPFNGETTVAIAIKHIQTPMPSPREFVPDIPRSVEQIVLKCCEKSPDRRYQNMTELIADLKQSLIHPNADFVKVINPDEDGATRMANPVEQSEIRRRSGTGPLTYEENLPQDDGAARRESTAGERGYAREHSYPPAYEENFREERDSLPENDAYSQRGPRGRMDEYDDRGMYEDRSRRSGRGERIDEPLRKNVRNEYDDRYDDYRDDGYGRRRERNVTILSVAAAVLIGVVIILFAASRMGLLSPGKPSENAATESAEGGIVLPEMIGKNAEDVKNSLNSLGLIPEITYQESKDYASGIVMSAALQDGTAVNEGSQVEAGTNIVLTVSTGQTGVEVPNVTGMTQAEAIAKLKQKGFDSINKAEGTSNEVDKGKVISQTPEGGTVAPADTAVTITISTGKDTTGQVQVPSVTGISREEAMAILVENNLQLGTTSEVETDDPNKVGLVISQDVQEDTFAEPGTKVNLTIGKAAKTEPSTYSYSAEISAPTQEEAPDYVAGSQVYVVIITADGQTLLNTTTTGFPLPASFTGITSATGTLQMSYSSTAADAVNGQRVVTRQLTFSPEN